MQMSDPIRHIVSCPVDAILAALPNEADPLWDYFSLRQATFKAHRRTRSIVFLLTNTSLKGVPVVMDMGYAPPALRDAAMACGQRLLTHFEGGKILRLLLTELPPGAAIGRHHDSGDILESTHRCHIPVLTNPAVTFMVDDVDYRLAAGEAYEFDNMRVHGVSNAGAERRIHLICDILPGGAD